MLHLVKDLFQKKISNQTQKTNTAEKQISFKIKGMHCVSCAMNIDDALEQKKGVIFAATRYAQSTTEVRFNPQLIAEAKVMQVIRSCGYEIERKI